jgi:hypothetical protein
VPLQCDPKIIGVGLDPNYRLQRKRSARRHHQMQGGAAGQNIVKKVVVDEGIAKWSRGFAHAWYSSMFTITR